LAPCQAWNADKVFAKLDSSAGFYQAEYKSKRMKLTHLSKELKHLGYWHTKGGWHDQYNLGLGLANTMYDDLAEAISNNYV